MQHTPPLCSYGPFWICTTLIFVTAAGGSAVSALNNTDDSWYYDVGEVTFSAVLFYGYATIVPLILYSVLRYLRQPLALTSLLCLYGYSLFIYVPISVRPLSLFPPRWANLKIEDFAGPNCTRCCSVLCAAVPEAGAGPAEPALPLWLLPLHLCKP